MLVSRDVGQLCQCGLVTIVSACAKGFVWEAINQYVSITSMFPSSPVPASLPLFLKINGK